MDKTYVIGNETERKYIQKLQYAWVVFCGGDKQSKDLEWVLRVPNTRNVKAKYAPDYPLVAWRLSEGQAYPLDELHSAAACVLAALEAQDKPQATGSVLTGNNDVIGQFNAAHTIEQCLASYGYTPRGGVGCVQAVHALWL